MPSSTHAVEFEDIVKSYDDKPVIRGLSLALPVNRTTAIVGESGSGKSTLLQLINGLIRPDSGSVRIQGKPLDYTPGCPASAEPWATPCRAPDCFPISRSGKT